MTSDGMIQILESIARDPMVAANERIEAAKLVLQYLEGIALRELHRGNYSGSTGAALNS